MRMHNSSIRVKKKQLKCGHFDFNFSGGFCKQCSMIRSINKQDERESIEVEDLSGLIEDADALISRYVRLKGLGEDKKIECYTCRKRFEYSEIDCSHYIPRTCSYLRWDLRNLRNCCTTCNRLKYGNLALYGIRLELESPGLPDILLEESRIVRKIEREELRAIISEYTEKIKQLKRNI